jgi:hypothetical protein
VEIKLGKGLVAEIDDEDAGLVAGFKWYAMKAPQKTEKYYAAGWKDMPPGRFFVHLHRLIMNAQPGQVVDHIDRNPLNCRRTNLRVVACRQNVRNNGLQVGKTSRFKGVSFCSHSQIFKAQLRHGKRRFWVGYFASEEDAARAYNAKATELKGEFAYLNDVPEE